MFILDWFTGVLGFLGKLIHITLLKSAAYIFFVIVPRLHSQVYIQFNKFWRPLHLLGNRAVI